MKSYIRLNNNLYNFSLNSNLEWKYWNNALGTNKVTFPINYNELTLEVERGESIVRYSILVSKTQLQTTELLFKTGQCISNTNFEAVNVYATNTYAKIASVIDRGNDVTTGSELRVYYR